jgi:uncharacterized coiled-coil DUF342 family protein
LLFGAGNAEKHLPASLAQEAATSFAQLRNSDQNDPALMKRVSEFLQAKAKKFNSRYLALIASRTEAVPFVKIKKMIKELIVKLMEEANNEAVHKGFCDMEMATNKNTRDKQSEDVINLTAQIDELKASIAKIAQDIQGFTEEIAELDASVAKATTEREEEKALKHKETQSIT